MSSFISYMQLYCTGEKKKKKKKKKEKKRYAKKHSKIFFRSEYCWSIPPHEFEKIIQNYLLSLRRVNVLV